MIPSRSMSVLHAYIGAIETVHVLSFCASFLVLTFSVLQPQHYEMAAL